MRNDQIFVLLLIVLLPLSGCFDGAVGDAEGTDETSSDTTIVNNYYNNTTTYSTEPPEYQYVVFDEEIGASGWNNTYSFSSGTTVVALGHFNTTANSIYSVIYSSATGLSSTGEVLNTEYTSVRIRSICGEITYNEQASSFASETSSWMLRGTANSDCTHYVTSSYWIEVLENIDTSRLHYELAFKEIPVTEL
tara:strand:- start:1581 stop:2159 length:579 start_codon:yes stop_codon:yes gene_type:complete